MFSLLKILPLIILLCAGFTPSPSRATSIFAISDHMSSQKIGTPSDHLIAFRSTSGVANGTITLDFGSVTSSMGSVDYTDIDLVFGPTGTETSTQLAGAAGAGVWGVAVNGATKIVTLTFPTSGGTAISANDKVVIKIGTNATSQTAGNAQMINAGVPGNNLVIGIAAGGDIGRVGVALPVNSSIGITGSQPVSPPSVAPVRGTILVSPPPPVGPIASTVEQAPPPQQITAEEAPIAPPAPTNVLSLSAREYDGDVELSWSNPNDHTLAFIQIQRKETGFPLSLLDGTAVARGLMTRFTDTNLVIGRTYYYTVFAVSTTTTVSSGSLVAVTIHGKIIEQPPAQRIPPTEKVLPPQTQSTITLDTFISEVSTPQQSHTILSATNSDGSGLTLTTPKSPAGQPSDFSIQPFNIKRASEWISDLAPSLMDSELVGGILYRVTATREGRVLTSFDTPLTLEFRYTPAQIRYITEETIKAYHWNASASRWIEEPSSVLDTTKNTVTIHVSHFSFFSLRGTRKTDTTEVFVPFQVTQPQGAHPRISNIPTDSLQVTDTAFKKSTSIINDGFGVFPSTALSICLSDVAVRYPVREVVLTMNSSLYLLYHDTLQSCYTATFESPAVPGDYPLTIKILYEDDAQETLRVTMTVAVRPEPVAQPQPPQTAAIRPARQEMIHSTVTTATPVLQTITIATIPVVAVANHALAAHIVQIGPYVDHITSALLAFLGFRKRRKPLVVTKKTLTKISLALLVLSFAASAILQFFTPSIFQIFALIANCVSVIVYLALLRQKEKA